MATKFYKCAHCGNVILKVVDSKVPVVCCGQKMTELIPGTTDAAVEKHFVTEVKQADGMIAVQRAQVANIALTGSTDDLVQGTMTLVFNCGNSAVGTADEFKM